MAASNLRGIVFLLLIFPFAAGSQTTPTAPQEGTGRTVVKANTRLVVVDVVATDSKGDPITDLGEQDFTILEDGRPQKISSFTFQHPQAPASRDPQLPPNVFTNAPASKTSSLNIILLDASNGEFSSRAYALDELTKYLESGPVIQPTAMYVLEHKLELLHDFTTDTKALRHALAGFRPQIAPHVDTAEAAASTYAQRGSFQAQDVGIQNTLKALGALAQSLAGYPGRKNLIWLSEAFPVNFFPESLAPLSTTIPPRGSSATSALSPTLSRGEAAFAAQTGARGYSDYLADVQKVADAFMGSQVAIYPIDAAGVGRISQIEALTTMRTMAERTGGKTFANQNDLKGSLRSSMDDGSTYYTLSYYPDNKTWDGKFRSIEIKSDRARVNLRFRQGYYALNPEADKEDAKRLSADFSQALAFDAPSSTAIPFHATVAPPASGQKLAVQFAIDPHSLSYSQLENGAQEANLGCAVVAYSGKGSMVRNEINNLTGKVKAENFPALMQSQFPCQCAIDLKPGKYTLRLGVVDKISRHMGTATASVTIQ